jgi:hypothetical protein
MLPLAVDAGARDELSRNITQYLRDITLHSTHMEYHFGIRERHQRLRLEQAYEFAAGDC